jgi:AcrR family transcriptional regulator
MTIYRRWSDMPQLLGDLMTREWGRLVTGVREAEALRAEPGPERFAAGLLTTVRALRANELFVRIVELDPELLLPYLLSRRGRSQEAILGLMEADIEAGQAAGSIRAGSPPAMARTILLAAHGHVLSAHTMVDDSTGEDDLDAGLVDLVERTLRP